MPHALDEIRKFGREGHEVYATDTFRTSPGNHSRYVKRSFITAPSAYEPERFLDDIAKIVREHQIDLILPGFEEVFLIAKHLDALAPAKVFCAPFETMARLHDKHLFVELAQELGLPVPDTRVSINANELRRAIAEFPEYHARPAFGRGGMDVLTNVGPLAGAVALEACNPTTVRPWIVQRFLHGEDVCCFNVAHDGRVVAHSAYIHPKTIEHAGGIFLESVVEPRALEISQRFVEHLDYTGQISFDFMRTRDGLFLVECNPRPTAGVTMMDSKRLVDAILAPDASQPPYVAPGGVREQIASAIVRDMFREWREIPSDLKALFSGAEDIYIHVDDVMPGVYQALSYSIVFAFRRHLHVQRHMHSDLVAAQFYDIAWNGGALP